MKEHSLIMKKVVWDYPTDTLQILALYTSKMRATWKAVFPALLFQVQKHKGTETRESSSTARDPANAGNRDRGQRFSTGEPCVFQEGQHCAC